MTTNRTRLITPLPEFTSPEASLYIAQLDDLSRRLREDIAHVTPQQLEWQPAPGMNTAGMLLAHIAIAEVYWASILTRRPFTCEQVLGIGADDDGMPCPEGGAPPPGLAGKPLAYFFDLLLKAREYTRQQLGTLTTDDLIRPFEQKRRDGVTTLNGHWILYHMVEHMGGHYAQINLLLHLQSAGVVRAATN
jgi:uncharacterized damage-inducible protein DinB